jgi:hypothetical protein
MSRSLCLYCRALLRQSIHIRRRHTAGSVRGYSSTPKEPLDIAAVLSKPSWSVRSLLPDPSVPPAEEITPKQLHHLLRLSALPQPKSPEEEAEMLKTLHSQLHFVRDIQSVNTDGVEPLQSIRDETEEGIKEATIGLDGLKEAFLAEEIKGRNKRPRRIRDAPVDTKDVEDWDVLGTASKKVETPLGKYFIVKSRKE